MPQKFPAITVFVSRVSIREDPPNVTLCDRTEQGIAECMYQHIAVRMGDYTILAGYSYPAQYQAIASTQSVNIVTVTYSNPAHSL